jgi:predicted transposase YbfD/YdcC
VQLDVEALRPLIRRQCKRALRSKSLGPDGLPFGVVSMDGRSTTTKLADEHYAQPKHKDGEIHHHLVRTITSALVSAKAKVCLDMCPIPAKTNEAGIFLKAFLQLIATYSEEVFQLIIYDAGACSRENAQLVEDAQRAYLFGLKDNQPELMTEAHRVLGRLGPDDAEAVSSEARGTDIIHRRIWRTKEMAGWHGWSHLRTVIRVEQERIKANGERTVEQRYFISSLRLTRLSAEQWLRVVRCHWGVENNNHWVYDAILEEDDRPWILQPRGMLAVMALRRIAFNILVIFRNVTQRSEERRATPWRHLIEDVRLAMLTLTASHTAGLRTRSPRALA